MNFQRGRGKERKEGKGGGIGVTLQEIIHNLSPIPTLIMFVIRYMYERLKPDEQNSYVPQENIRRTCISCKLTEK